jgi:hypothetical protein
MEELIQHIILDQKQTKNMKSNKIHDRNGTAKFKTIEIK